MNFSTLVIALLVGVAAAEIYLDERFDGKFWHFFFHSLFQKKRNLYRVYKAGMLSTL